MATGKASDFKIYHDQVYAGITEVQAQNSNVFGEVSRGALLVQTLASKGDYRYASFITEIASLITRRDTTSVAAATDLAIAQEEDISVKLNRKIGPIGQTLDAWRKIGEDDQHASFVLGQQIAKAIEVEYVNSIMVGLDGALDGQTSQEYDASNGILQIEDLVAGLNKMGDAAGKIVCWVMHSKVAHDLMLDHITNAITGPAELVIIEGSNASLGRPIVVTDDTTLFRDLTTDIYVTMGLVEGAAVVEESEPTTLEDERELGKENIIHRVQGEYAYNLMLKGFKWDVANGGANPTGATMATSTNWDKVVTDAKNLAGVHITSQ